MKKLKIMILMIVMILLTVSLSAVEIKIIKNKNKDVKLIKMNDLDYFLVTPLFMNEVERVDSYNRINEETINVLTNKIKDMNERVNESINDYKKKRIIIKVLIFTTATGFTISFGMIAGLIVYSVLRYYEIK